MLTVRRVRRETAEPALADTGLGDGCAEAMTIQEP
jgi:hypothetical protein